MIGEMVVLAGSSELPEGMAVPVPWEGVLGSVRSCDMVIPCPGIRKRHLRFSYESGFGLKIIPLSGCEAMVNGVLLDCRSGEKAAPMTHGSFLQIGSAVLRLRVFAGLDSTAGFGDDSFVTSSSTPAISEGAVPPPPGFPPTESRAFSAPGFPAPEISAFPPVPESMVSFPAPSEADVNPAFLQVRPDSAAPENETAGDSVQPSRRRRSDRWEADWSE